MGSEGIMDIEWIGGMEEWMRMTTVRVRGRYGLCGCGIRVRLWGMEGFLIACPAW
jgi:hypothetical protein